VCHVTVCSSGLEKSENASLMKTFFFEILTEVDVNVVLLSSKLLYDVTERKHI
jgi:hypothetical protein